MFSTEFTTYTEVHDFCMIWYYFCATLKGCSFVVQKSSLKIWKYFAINKNVLFDIWQNNSSHKLRFNRGEDKNETKYLPAKIRMFYDISDDIFYGKIFKIVYHTTEKSWVILFLE